MPPSLLEWTDSASRHTPSSQDIYIEPDVRGSLQGCGTKLYLVGSCVLQVVVVGMGRRCIGAVVGGQRLGQRLGEWSGVSESEAEGWSVESGW